MLIGIISDTHGILTDNAKSALYGVDHILHAGDVGGPEVLTSLQNLAPTTAVRGNMDGGGWSKSLPPFEMIDLGGCVFFVLHDLHTLDIDPQTAGIQVVISGHTHQPQVTHRNGILYFNPGSASHGRYGQASCVGKIELLSGKILPNIIALEH